MASYPVGDLPAVSDALEHLREVDKELRDDGGPFSAEASFHLSKITAALTHLEGYQRAAQEGLEAETTENRRLARRINQTKETTRQDILADVAAARTCGAAERDQLQGELMDVSRLLGATAERQEDLARQNETLQAEQAQARGEHQALAAALNHQLSITKALQTRLHRSREQTEELASCSVRAERDKTNLQRGMELERQAFTVRREGACREVERAEEQIKQQKQGVRRARRAVAGVRGAQRGAQQRWNELTFQMATLESSLQQVTASRSQCEEELERHRQTHRQLREKKELLRKDLQESKVTSGALIQRLREEIQALERDAQEARASGALHGDSLAGVCGTWAQQQEEESKARAEHLRAQQQLHRSTLQLQQRAAAIARRREEVREMEEQMAALGRAGAASQRLLERDLQEMSSTLEEQRRSALHWEEEKEKLAQLLEAARRRQEEREARLTSDLGRSRRRWRSRASGRDLCWGSVQLSPEEEETQEEDGSACGLYNQAAERVSQVSASTSGGGAERRCCGGWRRLVRGDARGFSSAVCPMGGGASGAYGPALPPELDPEFCQEKSDPLELLRQCEEALGEGPPRLHRNFTSIGDGANGPGGRMRVMQWNILAQALGEGLDSFVRCPPEALSWSRRKYLILEEILGHRPHILCLQEVDHYHDTLQPVLAGLGYGSSFCPKPWSPCLQVEGNNGPDGCALFFDHKRYDFLDSVNIRLSAMKIPTNQVAVATVLRCRSTGKRVCVAVTHLKARSGWERLRGGRAPTSCVTSTPWSRSTAAAGPASALQPPAAHLRRLQRRPHRGGVPPLLSLAVRLDSAYKKLSRGGLTEPEYTTWKIRPCWTCPPRSRSGPAGCRPSATPPTTSPWCATSASRSSEEEEEEATWRRRSRAR
ncbi:unnamed protein product [Tetraodon nigroviridis]|uniref:(spotted green pufferfish) hypothetical protein n=1 Tax=Tetraodon nigroviridis TaxID=99883 RepID=Q4S6M3_TETNG|nr:unnamed protein product [Tetraodon nigroviridis]